MDLKLLLVAKVGLSKKKTWHRLYFFVTIFNMRLGSYFMIHVVSLIQATIHQQSWKNLKQHKRQISIRLDVPLQLNGGIFPWCVWAWLEKKVFDATKSDLLLYKLASKAWSLLHTDKIWVDAAFFKVFGKSIFFPAWHWFQGYNDKAKT